MSETAQVSERTKQAESSPGEWDWVDRTIWTERRLAALGNGVKGNKGFSLIDKAYRPGTLPAACQKVKSNRGAAGIDRQSIESFAANAQRYRNELAQDLEGYVDSISPPLLNERIEQRISDGRLLALLAGWLRQDIVKGQERWTPTRGTLQGAVISPEVKAWVDANGLSLHPDKTHIGDCRIEGQGFAFLGYRFETGKRWVRTKSLQGDSTTSAARRPVAPEATAWCGSWPNSPR